MRPCRTGSSSGTRIAFWATMVSSASCPRAASSQRANALRGARSRAALPAAFRSLTVSRRSCTGAVDGEVVLGSVSGMKAVLEARLAYSQKVCGGNTSSVAGLASNGYQMHGVSSCTSGAGCLQGGCMSTLKMHRGKAIARTCGPLAIRRCTLCVRGEVAHCQRLRQWGHAAVERPSGSYRQGKWIDRCPGSSACRWRECTCAWRRIDFPAERMRHSSSALRLQRMARRLLQ